MIFQAYNVIDIIAVGSGKDTDSVKCWVVVVARGFGVPFYGGLGRADSETWKGARAIDETVGLQFN